MRVKFYRWSSTKRVNLTIIGSLLVGIRLLVAGRASLTSRKVILLFAARTKG